MIDRYGHLVARAIGSLSVAETIWKREGETSALAPATPPGSGPREVTASVALDSVRRLAILTDWDGLEPQIARLESRLIYADAKEIGRDFRILQERIRDELEAEYFFHLTPADVPLYIAAQPFGEEVGYKFPKAAEDIEEAAKSLALQRPTACVFHLMRAMEVIVKRLGKKLGVQNVEKDWGKILSDIAAAIEKMPKSTEAEKRRRNRWSEAHTHLYHVKQAWRNDTMHPKQTYTRQQAHEVFAATRVFAAHLAGLV